MPRHLPRPLRPFVLAAALAALALAGTQGALAAAPTPIAFSFSQDGVIECGAFQDQFTDFYTVEGLIFADADGATTRVVLHYDHASNDVNSVTGLTLHEHGHYTVVIDLVAGTITTTGNQGVITRPGAGLVEQGTGRRIYDMNNVRLFFAGGRQHNPIFSGDEDYCDALR
jgi:hypothetical protein